MRRSSNVSLNALRAVEAVGRLGSLAAAAAELHISPGAVSQQIRKAEELIGVPLFARTPSGLVLTPSGLRVLPGLEAGFRQIANAVDDISQVHDELLSITSGSAFAVAWLVPRLSKFAREQPDLQIRFVATQELLDLSRSDVDVGIRLGNGRWPGLHCEHLQDQLIFPVCSPGLGGKLQCVTDLERVPIIIDEGAMVSWSHWFEQIGLDRHLTLSGPSFTDPVLAFSAVLAGQGVMLGWSLLVSDALADGRLIRPFGGLARTDLAYWVATSEESRRKPKVKAFKSWLTSEVAASAALLPL